MKYSTFIKNTGMFKNQGSILLLCTILIGFYSKAQVSPEIRNLPNLLPLTIKTDAEILTGAEQIHLLKEDLANKRIGVIANQTSLIGNKHLVDSMLSLGYNVTKIFSPEHGFRGTADAGEMVNSKKDKKTGLPIISLYGPNKKPKLKDLIEIDILVYDLQDVGVRFYTYVSTLFYAIEACAEADIPLIVLDRPNPNGFYVDGPVLKDGFESFVGVNKIPVVYGLTPGEFSNMANNEGWLHGDLKCNLKVIPLKNYSHSDLYQLPVKPSPNLPNMTSVYLYPSLCFFEGTVVSEGRGTEIPFQIFGHPQMSGDFTFTPKSTLGASAPKLENQFCRGKSLTSFDIMRAEPPYFTLNFLKQGFEDLDLGETFFLENNFINLLAGTDELKNQILQGSSDEQIRASWEPELSEYKTMRKKYLLYTE
jgi:uncharacterized protein YbbC (DUF1343 family)